MFILAYLITSIITATLQGPLQCIYLFRVLIKRGPKRNTMGVVVLIQKPYLYFPTFVREAVRVVLFE
jgi:hypothetical protein